MTEQSDDVGPEHTDALAPAQKLGPWLREHTGDEAWLEPQIDLITGGKSNLTYRISSSAGTMIFRRPPGGDYPAGAHDVAREARVQRQLAPSPVPVAPVIGTEPTGELIGAPFYVMEAVDGYCIRESLPEGYAVTTEERRSIAFALVDTVAALHAVDPAEVGLADLGRPEGYVERQVRRWRRQWETDKFDDVPVVDELGALLEASIPEHSASGIVHGDCKLDNVLMDRDDPAKVRALLDWEMSTLGDPLADLGMLLLFWRHAGEHQYELVPAVSHLPGFPQRDELIEQYAKAHTFDERDLAFHEGLAHLKFAVIMQGIAKRSRSGVMAGQSFEGAESDVVVLATDGLARIRHRS